MQIQWSNHEEQSYYGWVFLWRTQEGKLETGKEVRYAQAGPLCGNSETWEVYSEKLRINERKHAT